MRDPVSRRSLLAGLAGSPLRAHAGLDQLGIMCQVQADEASARSVLAAASQAGFRRTQVTFPWDRADRKFLDGLPRWIKAENLTVDALGAYVNCAVPENVIMSTRAVDFDRALDYARDIGARILVAWTGGFGDGLMISDPRNGNAEASSAIVRFLDRRMQRIENQGLIVALESYITLVCPDAASLRRLLDRLPPYITAVLDPPNLTPVVRYRARDDELRAMFETLKGRIGIVHMKDFRLASDGNSYELPGPLKGVINYGLFIDLVHRLPSEIPAIAEHVTPDQFATTRRELSPFFER